MTPRVVLLMVSMIDAIAIDVEVLDVCTRVLV